MPHGVDRHGPVGLYLSCRHLQRQTVIEKQRVAWEQKWNVRRSEKFDEDVTKGHVSRDTSAKILSILFRSKSPMVIIANNARAKIYESEESRVNHCVPYVASAMNNHVNFFLAV